MKILVTIAVVGLLFLFVRFIWQDKSEKSYYRMINALISHSVQTVKVSEVGGNQLFLDARSFREFEVSHLPNAVFVGYDNFDISSVSEVDKHTEIVVYCSIGYRSEKVAEKLQLAGFTKVKNLYGGIFDWHNKGLSVFDENQIPTDSVHGYDRLWGKWLTKAKVAY